MSDSEARRRARQAYARQYRKTHQHVIQAYRADNKERIAERKRLWRKNNKHKERAWDLKKHYGLTVEEYDKLLLSQGGTCAICGCAPGLRRLQVDHNHNTGTVRALLCNRCNTALGMLNDSVEILKAAIRYIRKHEKKVRQR